MATGTDRLQLETPGASTLRMNQCSLRFLCNAIFSLMAVKIHTKESVQWCRFWQRCRFWQSNPLVPLVTVIAVIFFKTLNLFSLVGINKLLKSCFSNRGACPWSPLAFFLVNGVLSYIPTPSPDRVCSNHWSLTLSGIPVVKHSAPNLCEQSSQCVGSFQPTEIQKMMMMNSRTMFRDYLKDFLMPWWMIMAYIRANFFCTLNSSKPLQLQLYMLHIHESLSWRVFWEMLD